MIMIMGNSKDTVFGPNLIDELSSQNEDFRITKGKDKLRIYQFHTKIAKHYFCTICGIYTHHHPRSNPAMTGFNLGCIDEINTLDLKNIVINDGHNHPLDKK